MDAFLEKFYPSALPFSLQCLNCTSQIMFPESKPACCVWPAPAPFKCAGVFVSKNADTNQSPYCKFNDQRLQTFTSCLFLAGALLLLDLLATTQCCKGPSAYAADHAAIHCPEPEVCTPLQAWSPASRRPG